jgi:hypothetical protein
VRHVVYWAGAERLVYLDEKATPALKTQRDWLFGMSIAKRLLRCVMAGSLNSWCGHSYLAVAQRA